MSINWEDSYSVGVKVLDDQHKQFINTINDLYKAIESSSPKEKLAKIYDQLLDYEINHFATEEGYFAEFNYPDADIHIAEHRSFLKKIEKIKTEFQDDHVKLTFALIDFLEDWLINHLDSLDHKYTKFFNSHGLR